MKKVTNNIIVSLQKAWRWTIIKVIMLLLFFVGVLTRIIEEEKEDIPASTERITGRKAHLRSRYVQ